MVDVPPGVEGPPRSRRRRVVLFSFLAVAGILIAGGGFWAFTASAAAPSGSSDASKFTGDTEEIKIGDLQGTISITGTLRYADSRSIQAGSDGTVTALPTAGETLTRGNQLYAIDDIPTFLLTGSLPAWRDFAPDMKDGPDVKQLEQNLSALGFFSGEPDEKFRWATTEAITAWQKATGQDQTGRLPLGSVVFSAGDLRVGEISAGVGTRVGPGTPMFDASTTTQVVEANVKLSDQQLATVGAQVSVQLPGGASTNGKIASVGTPTEIEGSDGQKQTVIPVVISLDDPAAAATFQQAAVTVSVPTQKREGVLSVPLGALIALSSQQFGVEIVDDDDTTRKVPVTVGMFAGGHVEISGNGIDAGQRVVVPQR